MAVIDLPTPCIEILREQVPGLELFDAHTHLGENDPDGMRQSPDELLELLRSAHARGCFVFPFHEPDGYRAANDMVLEAARNGDGLLVPFCRVNPHDSAVTEAERALGAGAKGINLHPRAEDFPLDHPQVRSLFAIADERSLPILIHAGRGIPALGEHAIEYAAEFPGARIILAHAGITDLSWIWRAAADLPNLLFDTAWWMPADLTTLFSLVRVCVEPMEDPVATAAAIRRLRSGEGRGRDRIHARVDTPRALHRCVRDADGGGLRGRDRFPRSLMADRRRW